jgi:hypothetical protein
LVRSIVTRFLPWLAALVVAGGCAQRPADPADDVPVDPGQVPPIPINLTVEVSQGAVTLTWTVSDPTGVVDYRVYRATGSGAFSVVASPATTSYHDGQVVSGTLYRYQVAARRNGLEGAHSETVSGTPGLFSIVLESGAEITGGNAVEPGSRKIRVGLVAPANIVSFRLSEDSTFADAPPQGFVPTSPTAIFTLSPGDGLKRVFARFEDGGGASSEIVRGSIRLDTKAVILAVTEDSNGATLHVNDVLHIAVQVDTTGGAATVDVGSVLVGLRLFDDGTNGDTTPFDGSYERDLVISAGMETVRAVLVASFTDQVANRADPAGSSTRVTIAEPPAPVLFDASGSHVVGAGINLAWSRNTDADFARYRIFRSPPGGTTVSTSDALVADIPTRDTVTLSDVGLVGGATYTWGILAVDTSGFLSPLNPLTRAVLNDPQLSNADVAPNFGTPATVFQYSCTYRHAGNVAPTFVTVIVDANQVFAMTKVGSGSNWIAGEDYQASANLAAGGHTYYFQAVATDGSSTRNPASPLALGGPAVTP